MCVGVCVSVCLCVSVVLCLCGVVSLCVFEGTFSMVLVLDGILKETTLQGSSISRDWVCPGARSGLSAFREATLLPFAQAPWKN